MCDLYMYGKMTSIHKIYKIKITITATILLNVHTSELQTALYLIIEHDDARKMN